MGQSDAPPSEPPKNLLDRWQLMIGDDGTPRSSPAAIANTSNANLNPNRMKASIWDDLWTDKVPMPGNPGEATELKVLGKILAGDMTPVTSDGQPASNNKKGMFLDKFFHVIETWVPATVTSAIRQNFRRPQANRTFVTRLTDMKKDAPNN